MTSRLPPAWPKHLKVAPQPECEAAARHQVEQEMLDRAATYREQGQFREAEQLCVTVLTGNPRNPQALFLSGTLALDLDDTELAVLFSSRALQEKPEDPYYHLALAATHQRINEFELAARHFHRALALKPDLVGAFCGLGATLRQIRQSRTRPAALREGAQDRPRSQGGRGRLRRRADKPRPHGRGRALSERRHCPAQVCASCLQHFRGHAHVYQRTCRTEVNPCRADRSEAFLEPRHRTFTMRQARS